MKRKELEKALKSLGWWFLRHGGRHDIWTDGDWEEPIPRHTEINELLAAIFFDGLGKEENREVLGKGV